MYCTYYSMPKGTTEAEATPSGKKIQLVALDYASLETSYQSVSKTLDPLNKYFLKFSNNFSEGILSFLLLS